ncbi:MAG: hypothetical protein OIF58_02660 [Cohaesibacter sp.]|nr:hypothetical protein [Cohaesibacter sp.]
MIARMFFPILGVLVLSFISIAPVNAATIDLSPLTSVAAGFAQTFVEVIAAVLVGAFSWAAKKFFGLQIDAKQRESLHGAIERGIGAALDVLSQKAKTKNSFDVDHEIVALVANYVIKMSPEAVKYFGLTSEKLAEVIKAKFGERLIFNMEIAEKENA